LANKLVFSWEDYFDLTEGESPEMIVHETIPMMANNDIGLVNLVNYQN
jgi:hypothetical protein